MSTERPETTSGHSAGDGKATQPDTQDRHHIGVCIPTFKRPEILERLLNMLAQQQTGDLFHYSVHVVDNDSARSAESVVSNFANRVPFAVTYAVEPVQNISLARNRVLNCADGDFLAFIDDDEIPTDTWLLSLYRTCRQYNADGVLGQVRPLFDSTSPSWLVKSGLCERPSFRNGTILGHEAGRTGNVLLRRSILDGLEAPFRPEKGRSGGEDIEFFRFMVGQGRVFVWCDHAPVYEHIGPDRRNIRYYFRRALRIGGLSGEMLRSSRRGRGRAALRSICALSLHVPLCILGVFLGAHIWARYSAKAAYHFGRICGIVGFVPIRYRSDS